jgi:hypothetical protein
MPTGISPIADSHAQSFDPFTLHLHHAFSDFDAACAASVAKPILVGS